MSIQEEWNTTIKENSISDVIVKPNGDRITRQSIVNDGEQFYEEAYQNKLSEICDFSVGSEIRTLHESFAVEVFSLYKEMYRMAKMKYVLDSEGTYLDRLGCEYHLTRKKASVATGIVTFSTDETLLGDYKISEGTVLLAHDTGYEYILTENVVLRSSAVPVNGTVVSKLQGYRYNVTETDKVTVFQEPDRVQKSIKVTNHTPIIGGSNKESDEEFRKRILNAKRTNGWGTVSTYNELLKEKVNGVHDVQFVDPHELLENENYPPHIKHSKEVDALIAKVLNGEEVTFEQWKPHYCTDCTRVLFINGFNKPIDTTTLEMADYVMTQQNNLVIGQVFHVQQAEVIPLYFKIEMYCNADISEDVVYEHLCAFMDGGVIETKTGDKEYVGLNINETLSKRDLLNVLEDIPGVDQVGELKILKYNDDLSKVTWTDNADGSYTYTDEEGFIFTKTKNDKLMSPWGERNFVSIQSYKGQVFQCGQMKNEDNTLKSKIMLTKIIDNK